LLNVNLKTNAVATLLAAWDYKFKDCRLILEQSGNLKYLYITSQHQRFAFRSALIALAIGLLMVSLTISYYFYLQLHNSDLMHSNVVVNKKKQMAFDALAAAYNIHPTMVANMSDKELKEYAERMRERDKSMRQLVEFASNDLAQSNKLLELALAASGLTKSKINQMKSEMRGTAAKGGVPNPLTLDTEFEASIMGHIHTNQALKDVLNMMPQQNPVPGSKISSSYGLRQHPITGKLELHPGLDFVPTTNNKIFAPLPGKVLFAAYRPGYGNTVILKHTGGIETLFAHLDKIHVKGGMQVEQGEILGIAGNTGLSTGTHLHYEVKIDGVRVNPLTLIAMTKPLHQ
jgi:murein DD-endopeptidase MepM/ murein hydrolase activator NlpD